MNFDGTIEPQSIVIQMPRRVVERFANQFVATGLGEDDALDAARKWVYDHIERYIPAGTPFVVMDENRDVLFFPQLVSSPHELR